MYLIATPTSVLSVGDKSYALEGMIMNGKLNVYDGLCVKGIHVKKIC